MPEHVTKTGAKLQIKAIASQNALQSLMSDAGIFTWIGDKTKQPPTGQLIGAWQRLFNYCVMNGVEDSPTEAEMVEVAAMGFMVSTPNLARLNWVRYGSRDGRDILSDQRDAADLVTSIIALTFKKPEEAEDKED